MIRRFRQRSVFLRNKGIIIFRSTCSGSGKSISDFKAFDSTDGKDCFRQTGIQFVKNRITDAGRNPCDHTFNNTTGGILLCNAAIQKSLSLFCSMSIWHSNRILTDLCGIKMAGINGYRSDRFGISKDRNTHFL